jgi:VIT1/CCC1 family predicted Fe2+/Mn2+ transporter
MKSAVEASWRGASNYLARRSAAAAEERASREEGLRHAAVTLAAFVVAGFLPLLAYVVPVSPESRFGLAVGLTASLFAVGAARSLVTGLSAVRSGLEMLLVGSLVALAAYFIGVLASSVTGID